MSSISRDDILVTRDDHPVALRPLKTQFAAFVPITIAIVGLAAILFGGISAKPVTTADGQAIDPIATGSIEPAPAVGIGH